MNIETVHKMLFSFFVSNRTEHCLKNADTEDGGQREPSRRNDSRYNETDKDPRQPVSHEDLGGWGWGWGVPPLPSSATIKHNSSFFFLYKCFSFCNTIRIQIINNEQRTKEKGGKATAKDLKHQINAK